MKKIQILFIFGLLLMLSGCTGSQLVIEEGTYNLTPDFNWKNIDLKFNTEAGLKLIARYSDWKDETGLEFLVTRPVIVEKYGALTLGNNRQKFEFAITKNNNFIDELYIDRNGDGQIGKDEVIQLKKDKKYNGGGYDWYYSYALDFPIYVPYLKADGTTVSKAVYIWMAFFNYDYHSLKNQDDLPSIVMLHSVSSYMKGEMTISYQNEVKTFKFILMDGDGNANFNDFGIDYFIMDKNHDSKFGFSSERQDLLELFETTVKDDSGAKMNKTLRLSLFAYPEKFIVANANDPAPDEVELEPSADDDWEAVNNKTDLLNLLKKVMGETETNQ